MAKPRRKSEASGRNGKATPVAAPPAAPREQVSSRLMPHQGYCAMTIPGTRATKFQALAAKLALQELKQDGAKVKMEGMSDGEKYVELPVHVVRWLLERYGEDWEKSTGSRLEDCYADQDFK